VVVDGGELQEDGVEVFGERARQGWSMRQDNEAVHTGRIRADGDK